jgi:hypothetical protein
LFNYFLRYVAGKLAEPEWWEDEEGEGDTKIKKPHKIAPTPNMDNVPSEHHERLQNSKMIYR